MTPDPVPYRSLPPATLPAIQTQRRQEPGLDSLLSESAFLYFRHKGKIVFFTLAGIAAAAYVWFTAPTFFRSEARLLVRYVADTVTDPASSGGRVLSPDIRGANILNSEIAILTSRELLADVVDTIGPERFAAPGKQPPSRDAALLTLSRNLHADAARNSNIISVFCDTANPRLSQEILSNVITLYLEKHISIHRSGLAYNFLAQQTDEKAARLAETEDELRKLKAEAGVGDLAETKANIVARTERLRGQLYDAEAALAGSAARYSTMQTLLPSLPIAQEAPGAVPEQPDQSMNLFSLRARLTRLREREATLLVTYTEESLPVRGIRNEIEKAEELWRTSVSAGTASVAQAGAPTNAPAALGPASITREWMAEQSVIASLRAQIEVINRHLADAAKDLARIEQMESRLGQLERKREIEVANYLYFSKSLEQARVDDALDAGKISNIGVVQAASYPLEAISPNRLRNTGIALGAGLFAGLALAFLKEKAVNARWFTRPSEVTACLGLPILVTIPRVRAGKLRRMARAAKKRSKGAAASVAPTPWATPNGFTDYCEALQLRVVACTDIARGQAPLVGVTGCSHGVGVSTIASGIALSLAHSAEDVRGLLVSASLEHAAEVFLDKQGRVTVVDRNRYVVSDTEDPDKAHSLVSPVRRFHEFSGRIRQSEYAFVVVDMPPVSETGITAPIAGLLDAVVLVIEAEKDRRASARHAVQRLAQAGAKVVGTVFNKRRTYVPGWLSDEG